MNTQYPTNNPPQTPAQTPLPGPQTDKDLLTHHLTLLKQPDLTQTQIPEPFKISLAHQRLIYLYYTLTRKNFSDTTDTCRITLTPNNPPTDTTPPYVLTLLQKIVSYLENQTLELDERFHLSYLKLDTYYAPPIQDEELPPNPDDSPIEPFEINTPHQPIYQDYRPNTQ